MRRAMNIFCMYGSIPMRYSFTPSGEQQQQQVMALINSMKLK
jgi:hypothetical protein